MADQADVEQTLVGLTSAVLYPDGLVGDPPLTVIGAPGRVYRGWPNGDELDADLRAGIFHVSIWARPGMERNTTRYLSRWNLTVAPVVTVTAAVAGQTITFGGTVTLPLNIAVKALGKAWAYAVQPGDTLTAIAAALAALINADTPATSSGQVLTLPNGGILAAALGGSGTVSKEFKRQQKQFQIIFWCPNPAIRDQACSLVDQALCQNEFIALPDGAAGRIIYQSTTSNDAPEKELLFRRDLFYGVEYATIGTKAAPQIIAVPTNIEDIGGAIIATTVS